MDYIDLLCEAMDIDLQEGKILDNINIQVIKKVINNYVSKNLQIIHNCGRVRVKNIVGAYSSGKTFANPVTGIMVTLDIERESPGDVEAIALSLNNYFESSTYHNQYLAAYNEENNAIFVGLR